MSHYAGSVPDTATRAYDWLAVAPCKADPDAMFATTDHGIEDAKAVCRRCTAVDRCLQWALDTGEEHGVWGGLSEAERRPLRPRRPARTTSLDQYTGARNSRPPAATLQERWDTHAVVKGDHVVWTGPKVIVQPGPAKDVTVHQLSFFLDRGRWPEGDTKRTCLAYGCVAPAHLADRRERRAAREAARLETAG